MQVKGPEWKFGLNFKKKKERKKRKEKKRRKKKKRCVAQQRVNLTKKEGIF